MVYIPYAQSSSPRVTVVVRSSLRVAQIDRAIRAAVHDADASLAIQNVDALDDLLADSLGQQRLKSVVLVALACLAVVLACTGIYGVTAFLMVDRTHEIAIRMALGADSASMLGRLVWETSVWTVSGVLIGLMTGWTAGLVWAANLPELHESGLAMYTGVAVMLVGVRSAAAGDLLSRRSQVAFDFAQGSMTVGFLSEAQDRQLQAAVLAQELLQSIMWQRHNRSAVDARHRLRRDERVHDGLFRRLNRRREERTEVVVRQHGNATGPRPSAPRPG